MAVTAKWYGNGLKSLASGLVNYPTDTIKAVLVTSAYTPNQDTHTFYSDITGEVATGNGYTAGGVALGTKTLTYDATSNNTRLSSAAASWTATSGNTITARYLVLFKDTGTATTSPLLGYVDFGADTSATGAAFTVTPDATNGWLYINAA